MILADLHIHSHYSMATSKKMDPEHLEYWARLKGIDLLGTGDCARRPDTCSYNILYPFL